MNIFRNPPTGSSDTVGASKRGLCMHSLLLVLGLCFTSVTSYGPYQGCYLDATPRALDASTDYRDGNRMTIELCQQHCLRNNTYTYLGLQYTYVCFCGENYDRYGSVPEYECSHRCPGNGTQKCGAGDRNSVYAVCPIRRWGKNCEKQCHCDHPEVCNRANGTCNATCLPGWAGPICNQPDCTNQNGNCEHICETNDVSFRCRCNNTGYNLDPDGRGCNDVDECTQDVCSAGVGFCENTIGSYTCSCQQGYQLKEDNLNECTDSDECSNGAHLCSAGRDFCHNTNGSYSCRCPDGYQQLEGNLYNCTDIDECFNSTGPCEGTCENVPGSFICICPEGLVLDNDGLKCSESGVPIAAAVGAVVGILVAAAVIVVAIIFFRRRFRRPERELTAHKNPAYDGSDITKDVAEDVAEVEEVNVVEDKANFINKVVDLPATIVVPLSDIDDHYALLCKNNGEGFLAEYKRIPEDERGSCTAAKDPAIKDKNKFKNILPYDHNRVVLEGRNSISYQDYVNASYIKNNDGFQYIATQGPQRTSTNVFWRMVWQEGTCIIVMLTNPEELGKVKCVEYWPEKGTEQHGNIEITLHKEERIPDFIRRTLTIAYDGHEREVRQYHFTTWPDHGAPHSPTGLLKMLYKVRAEPSTGKPIVVHCSAGVGRTGTFIAIDLLLKQADQNGFIDVVACINDLRNSRMKMVQTVAQYRYIYAALLEGISTGITSFPCSNYNQLDKDKEGKKQYQALESTTKGPETTDTSDALLPKNKDKNRSPMLLPLNRYRVWLNSGSSDYINAVFVGGFSRSEEFVATQVPLDDTVDDFWQMVYSYKCPVIVILESYQPSGTLSMLFPHDSSVTITRGEFTVRLVDTKQMDSLQVLDMVLTKLHEGSMEEEQEPVYANAADPHKLEPKRTSLEEVDLEHDVKAFVVKGEITEGLLVEIYAKVQKWKRMGTQGPTVVVCSDGVTKCGLYIGSDFLLDMIAHEQEVDVFYAVRSIRKFRPEFIVSEEQYHLLNRTAVEYLKTFEIYSNFI